MSVYKKVSFWEGIKRTIAVLSGPTVVGLHEFGAADVWVMASGALSMLGAIISIWFTDINNNGKVDIFEDTGGIKEKVGS